MNGWRRWLPHPLLVVVLAVVWVLLVGSVEPGAWIAGAVFGWAIALATRRFWPDAVRIARPLVLLRFIALVLADIVVAALVLAVLLLSPLRRLRPAFMEIPLDLRSDLAISLLANTISLTPGTVSCWLSPDRRSLLVHTLHTADPAAEVAKIKSRYEAPLKAVFEA